MLKFNRWLIKYIVDHVSILFFKP